MKRPLILWIAPLAIFGRGVVLIVEGLFSGSASHHYFGAFVRPVLFIAASGWLWWQPKWAKWVVGIFFLAITVRGVLHVLAAPSLSAWLISCRPILYGLAVWFAYGLLAGRSVRKFLISQENPARPPP
jgi:hypothetical protein